MVLGHEAAGVVTAVGANVAHLKVGDRVCMEPGIPDFGSRQTLEGHYNLDPSVRFWATPPIHGCLTPEVVHPAALTYKLPDNVSLAEGAMVEPLAIGVYAAFKGDIRPGDIAVVAGAGTIGMMVAFAALASGCAKVIVSDIAKAKLDLIADLPRHRHRRPQPARSSPTWWPRIPPGAARTCSSRRAAARTLSTT